MQNRELVCTLNQTSNWTIPPEKTKRDAQNNEKQKGGTKGINRSEDAIVSVSFRHVFLVAS